MKLKVRLNGTDTNPFHRLGVTQNPFPQIASYEHGEHCLHLQKLGPTRSRMSSSFGVT